MDLQIIKSLRILSFFEISREGKEINTQYENEPSKTSNYSVNYSPAYPELAKTQHANAGKGTRNSVGKYLPRLYRRKFKTYDELVFGAAPKNLRDEERFHARFAAYRESSRTHKTDSCGLVNK